jgi:hypothetical protein
VAIAVGILPLELGVIGCRPSREPITRDAGGHSQPPPDARPRLAILVPALLVAAIVGFGILSLAEVPVRDALFGWLPDWFVAPVALESVTDYSASAWYVTLVGYFALNVVLGPVTEELYFRGYLLPRMSQFGHWAPLLNVALFSLYHFWSPWQLLSRIAGDAYAYAVWRQETHRNGGARVAERHRCRDGRRPRPESSAVGRTADG